MYILNDENLKSYLRKYDPSWYHNEITEIEELSKVYYGHIKHDDDGQYLEVPFCGYSDYSGTTVERSNCDCFLEQFKDNIGNGVWELYGGYGTRGVLISLQFYLSNNSEYVKDIIQNLFQYPCIDDESMSKLEYEIEVESWNDYIKSDLIREFNNRCIYYEDETEQDDFLLRQKFYDAMERANEYFVHEDAHSAYVDISKVVDCWIEDEIEDDSEVES